MAVKKGKVLGSVGKSLKGLSTGKKVALGVAAAGAVGLGAYALSKRFGGKKRRSSVSTLRNKVEKTALKIKHIQLQRKLMRERLKW